MKGPGNVIPLAGESIIATSVNASTLIMDADGEELAIKYWPATTSPISAVDLFLSVVGTTTGINLRIRIESDNADAPSGTILGATNNAISSSFTCTASGFTGLKTLSENTGNLTVNVPVWIIVYRYDGTSLSASNYFRFQGLGTSGVGTAPMRNRVYTGGNWTTTPGTTRIGFVVKHADNSYDGMPFSNQTNFPAVATDIYGTYRHGIRCKFGCQVKFSGVAWYATKSGSPNSLVVSVYEGATEKFSETIPAATIVTAAWINLWFTSPVLVAADTNIYVVLKQSSDGGTDANDYDSKVCTISSTYRESALAADMAFVYGTGDDPTAYSVSDTDVPMLTPLLFDPAADFDQSASGGGGNRIFGSGVIVPVEAAL